MPRGRPAIGSMMTELRLTPQQRDLRHRLFSVVAVGVVASVTAEVAAALGELWDGRFYWAAGAAAAVLLATSLWAIAIIRSLRRSGPPFRDLKWWWPRRCDVA
jgi:hypothetical protein